jgi:hypothetical protein
MALNGTVARTRLFTEALNARDLDTLREEVAEDAQFPTPSGRRLEGHAGLEKVVAAAKDTDLLLARNGIEVVTEDGGAQHVTVPVREFVGRSEHERTAVFDLRGDKVTAFEVVPVE